ncbi:MAG TPA: hypothetical protein VG293_09815, partial [Solirubrobacteraceae bacterium]|nr:hypothetical protein [Solirubrobacteraceae bacterium]
IKYGIHVQDHSGLRLLIVTAAFVVINVILFFAKFAVYEYLIFPGGRGSRRSRGKPSSAAPERPATDTDPVEREPALSPGPAS